MRLLKLEKAELWLECEGMPTCASGKALRGFFGHLYRNRTEFHHHDNRSNRLVYNHPLIQYKIIDKDRALVVALKEGAYLLKAVPRLTHLELYHKKCLVLKQKLYSQTISFGVTPEPVHYQFLKPWVPLNEKNYVEYLRLKRNKKATDTFLERILIGNIISMCKIMRYTADDKIEAEVRVEEIGKIHLKPNVSLLGFRGEFSINFLIPDFWGIGKSSARGYGTVLKRG